MRWNHTFNIQADWKRAEDREITVLEFVEIVVTKIKKSRFYQENDSELQDIIDNFLSLGKEDTWYDFDAFWHDFYDYCDNRLIWVEIF